MTSANEQDDKPTSDRSIPPFDESAGMTGRIVNALAGALTKALENVESVPVQYGIPGKEESGSDNFVSIFLYDVHEDLKTRHGEMLKFNIGKRSFDRGFVWLNYCFLITFWNKDKSSSLKTEAQRTLGNVTESVIKGLINLRALSDVPGSNCQILPPSEELNSLGSFWQALGDKPRLSLSYRVTAPMPLMHPEGGAVGMIRPFEE